MNTCSFVVIGVTIQTSESLLNWEIFPVVLFLITKEVLTFNSDVNEILWLDGWNEFKKLLSSDFQSW